MPRQSLSNGKSRQATGQAKSNPSTGKYSQGKAKAKVQITHSQKQMQSISQATHLANVLGIKTWGANADDYSATILPFVFFSYIHTYIHTQPVASIIGVRFWFRKANSDHSHEVALVQRRVVTTPYRHTHMHATQSFHALCFALVLPALCIGFVVALSWLCLGLFLAWPLHCLALI